MLADIITAWVARLLRQALGIPVGLNESELPAGDGVYALLRYDAPVAGQSLATASHRYRLTLRAPEQAEEPLAYRQLLVHATRLIELSGHGLLHDAQPFESLVVEFESLAERELTLILIAEVRTDA